MTCGDNKQSSKSKVQRENKNRSRVNTDLKKLKVGQVAEGGASIQIFHY